MIGVVGEKTLTMAKMVCEDTNQVEKKGKSNTRKIAFQNIGCPTRQPFLFDTILLLFANDYVHCKIVNFFYFLNKKFTESSL